MAEGDGAIRDYSVNPSKAHWRRTAWNFIREWSDPEGIGMVLLGAQALDIPVAECKRISRDRILAVERNAAACRALRRQGIPTVHGDVRHVIPVLGARDIRLGFVLADMCGPIEAGLVESSQFLLGWFGDIGSRLAFVVNLLRGRERDGMGSLAIGKHRGKAFWDLIAPYLDLESYPSVLRRRFEVYFHSYRSGGLVYDSAMIGLRQMCSLEEYSRRLGLYQACENIKVMSYLRAKHYLALARLEARSEPFGEWRGYRDHRAIEAVDRSITANLAVLTARGMDWRLSAPA